MALRWWLLCGLCLGFATACAGPARAPRNREPRLAAIDQLLRAATRRAGLDPDGTRALGRRARIAALLPEVRAGLARTLSRDQSLSQWDAGERLGASADDRLGFDVHLTWRLDRLLAHPLELAAGREAAAQARARRELESEVLRAYFEAIRARRRVDRALRDGAPSDEREDLELEAEAALARLVALTGDGGGPREQGEKQVR